MAKFRLKAAHILRNTEVHHPAHSTDVWLPGDKENEHLGDGVGKGTIVGTGTPYPVVSATLEMVALDEEAEVMIAAEEQRLSRHQASMNPIDQLPVTLQQLFSPGKDDYEERFVPGFNGTPRPVARAPSKGA